MNIDESLFTLADDASTSTDNEEVVSDLGDADTDTSSENVSENGDVSGSENDSDNDSDDAYFSDDNMVYKVTHLSSEEWTGGYQSN